MSRDLKVWFLLKKEELKLDQFEPHTPPLHHKKEYQDLFYKIDLNSQGLFSIDSLSALSIDLPCYYRTVFVSFHSKAFLISLISK